MQDIAFGTIAISSLFLLVGASSANATTSAVDEVTIIVPASCSLTNTIGSPHTATIETGVYQDDIGETTFKVFCNDNEGFAVYAIGYSDNEYGNTVMKPSTLAVSNAIATGTATSGNTSNWAMKLTAVSGTYAPTLETGFNDYHIIPDTYTKVATYASNTDASTGSSFKSTYSAFISQTQPADAYTGKVKYTVVHPANADTPVPNLATLDTGVTVNTKLKSLAATVVSGTDTTISTYTTVDNYVKSIDVHLETTAPAGFTPSEKNTISSSASNKPIYIVFDNTNDAGIMHFYTEGERIFLPADSSSMFRDFRALSGLSAISDWDSSNVTNMYSMFYNAGYNVATFALDLSSWNTSNVTDMSGLFASTGYNATTWAIDGLSSWDTSNVTSMDGIFNCVGYSASTFALDLSSWNVSSVVNMSFSFSNSGYSATSFSLDLHSWDLSSVISAGAMFANAGHEATTLTFDLSSWNTSNITSMNSWFSGFGTKVTNFTLDLSSWDTSNVTDMNGMFAGAGNNATNFTLDLSSWNTSSVTNMGGAFSGAGSNTTTFTLNLSSWNTSNVINMSSMLSGAGYNSTTWSITIPQTNGNGISNATDRIYGKTTSTYDVPRSGKSFTLAQS